MNKSDKEKLCNRIRILEKEYIADEDEPMSELSLIGMWKFFKDNPKLKYPDTSVTDIGNMYCAWSQDDSHHVSIAFLSDRDALLIVFTPGIGSIFRTSENCFISDIRSLIKNCEWCYEPEKD